MLDKSEIPAEEPVVIDTRERTRPGRSWRSRSFSFLIGCVIVAGVVVWVEGPWQQSSQSQQRSGGGGRRGGGPGGEGPVPVLAAPATVADVPVYIDGVGTTRALNTVT